LKTTTRLYDLWITNRGTGITLIPFLNNGCAVDMETATKNHLSLNFYKRCSKYIQKLHPKLSKGEVYEVMNGIYEEKYSGDDLMVLEFRKLLGDQAPTAKAIEKNPTNVLRVYRQILQYYKAYEEKKTPGNTEFHQRKRQKKKKIRSQKRGPLETDQRRRLKQTAEKTPEKKESALHIVTCEKLLYHIKYIDGHDSSARFDIG
jgi:hypothetical protein